MEFAPKTLKEIQEERLWPKGTYPFNVMKAEEKVSKSGNPMFKLEIAVYNTEGRSQTIFEYLMPSQPEKLEQFCRLTGIEDKYLSGRLTDLDMDNREGYCVLKVQPEKDGYPAKNVISYYCPAPGGAGPAPKKPLVDDEDQEIPF